MRRGEVGALDSTEALLDLVKDDREERGMKTGMTIVGQGCTWTTEGANAASQQGCNPPLMACLVGIMRPMQALGSLIGPFGCLLLLFDLHGIKIEASFGLALEERHNELLPVS